MASWNPALRPDTEPDARTHDGAVLRSATDTTSKTAITNDNANVPAEEPLSQDPALEEADAEGPEAGQEEPEDEFFVRHGGQLSYDAHANTLISRATGLEEEAQATEPQTPPENTSTSELISAPPVPETELSHEEPDLKHPAEGNYEPQGPSTFLEEATQESAVSPLVTRNSAISGWGNVDGSFDIGTEPEADTTETKESTRNDAFEWDGVDDEFDLGGSATKQDEQDHTANVSATALEEPAKEGSDIIDWGTSEDQDFDFGGGPVAAQVAKDASLEPAAEKKEDLDAMWSAAFDDEDFGTTADESAFLFEDDEGFLEEPTATTLNGIRNVSQSSDKYAPTSTSISSDAYPPPPAPAVNATTQNPTTAYGGYGQGGYGTPQRPAITNASAQSFADKNKGGYASPYDLPTDIIQPKKRVTSNRAVIPATHPTPPPPRSSSMTSTGSSAPPRSVLPSNLPAAGPSPPSSSGSHKPTLQGQLKQQSSTSDFFADLPSVTRPRPSGRYTPQPVAVPAHSQAFPVQQPIVPPASIEQKPSYSQLRQPERLSMFPDAPSSSPSLAPGVPPNTSRYSPAPAGSTPSNSRYSPAPPNTSAATPMAPPVSVPSQTPAGAPSPNKYSPQSTVPVTAGPSQNRPTADPPFHPRSSSQSFLPRTSSPLVQHHMSQAGDPSHQSPSSGYAPNASAVSTTPPPPPRSVSSSMAGSPRKRSTYTPQYQPMQSTSDNTFAPPRRSQTSSPGATIKSPPGFTSFDRPTSEHGPRASTLAPTVNEDSVTLPSRLGFSHNVKYAPPVDERAADPLERWKGYPIFKWGLGGTVITSFPKHVPRYGAGSSLPVMKCTPGEVKLQNLRETLPLPDAVSKFPGPLKGKGKKKDVLVWLKSQIEVLEHDFKPIAINGAPTDVLRSQDERLLLWKVLSLFIEHDGKLEGSTAVDDAVKQVLSAGMDIAQSSAAGQSSSGASSNVQPEPLNPQAVDELRLHLSSGDREKAAWHAVDNRLWGHAMLISSTLSKDVWKKVVEEFVRQEVKKIGGNNQALASLYEVFAGNWEESVDQLVPASARAGFQMMNTSGPPGLTPNALEGLNKWRESLLLILSNRSEGDVQALISLARLLAAYDRTEAAHICCLFARSIARVAGSDDVQADLVLLGANHKNFQDIARDLEAILLTEVYEFGLSLSSNFAGLPHLQAYKLLHAHALAEHGQRNKAISYCDSIAASIKSSTRSSPYYNGTFLLQLDDLTKRLSQAPKDGSSGWLSKPSVDRVSGSLLAKFNSFVAGDDTDTASSKAGGADIGPFSKIAGNTPNISPSQSTTDLYGQLMGNGSVVSPTSTTQPQPIPVNSRYAPGGSYTPHSPPSQYEPRQSSSYGSSGPYTPHTTSQAAIEQSHSRYEPQQSNSAAPSFTSAYSPQVSYPESSHAKNETAPEVQEPSYGYSPYGANQFQPVQSSQSTSDFPVAGSTAGYSPPLNSFETSNDTQTSNGYAPPSMGSYEPPSYQPYAPEPEAEDQPGPKKKTIFDDDGDDEILKQAEALKRQQRAQADKEAEENFKRAAEADAARAQGQAGDKKGWFGGVGGWFKKDPNAAPGPIKAKLGEESSFVYDPNLKRWVDKKGGSSAAAAAGPPPPPPMGPSSRAPSGGPPMASGPPIASGPPSRAPTSMPPGPPSGPPSRTGTPSSVPGAAATPPTGLPPMAGAPPSGPPSRPTTSMSNASSIDDLLGAPQARKGGTVKKGRKSGRYVDVMAAK